MALFPRTARTTRFGPHSTIAELRGAYDAIFERFGEISPGVTFEPAQMGLVKGEWVQAPRAVRGRLILYFHGGGFIAGSPLTHRPLVSKLCLQAQSHGLVVQYRLAPEYPFPAPVRDGVDIYRNLLKGGLAPEAVVLAGDGAGGGLAFATLLAIRNGNLPMPAAIVALSPWADLSLSGMSMMTNAESDEFLSWELLFLSARNYLKKLNPNDPYASPAFANFKDFPPIMVHAGSKEILRDDASKLGDRAAEAGVKVNIEIYDGMQHLFQMTPGLKEAKISMERLGQFIHARTHNPMKAPRAAVAE
ncbi:MAG TPA: alpha/beta hydrolase fold domain-containing protein [Rhizomicrobium sp.]|nr:alpha/beta hydrolase fold domain-containing protein [Rhizomicrobium sp.]